MPVPGRRYYSGKHKAHNVYVQVISEKATFAEQVPGRAGALLRLVPGRDLLSISWTLEPPQSRPASTWL